MKLYLMLGIARGIALLAIVVVVLAFALAATLVYEPSMGMVKTTTTTVASGLPTATVVTVSTSSVTVNSYRTITETATSIIGFGSNVGIMTVANISVGESLWDLAVNPLTNKIYVPNSNTTVISGNTNNITTTVPVPGGSLHVAVSPTTNLVYVNNDSCGSCAQSIIVINGSTDKVVGSINLGVYVDGIAVDPNTDTIYASSANSNSLFIVNGVTNSIEANVSLPGSAMTVAVNPNTNTVYVPVCTTSFACGPAFVFVISGNSHSIISKVPIDLPFAISVDTASNVIYVTTAQNLLVGIDGNTNQVTTRRLSAYAMQCRGLAINSIDNEIYVSCSSPQGLPSFFIVDGSNNNILNSFVDNGSPMGVAFDSNNSLIYLAHDNGYVLALTSRTFLLP